LKLHTNSFGLKLLEEAVLTAIHMTSATHDISLAFV